MELRKREAGAERADVDAVMPVLERERLAEADQIRLRRRVKRVAGRCGHQARERGDVDHAPETARAHAGNEAMAERGRRRDHDLDELGVRLPVARDEAAGDAVACVVDEHVDRDAAALRLGEQECPARPDRRGRTRCIRPRRHARHAAHRRALRADRAVARSGRARARAGRARARTRRRCRPKRR